MSTDPIDELAAAHADEEAARKEWKVTADHYDRAVGVKLDVKDEIKTLEGELIYWEWQSDLAFERMVIADTKFMDACDRMRTARRRAIELADGDEQEATVAEAPMGAAR